MSNDSAAHIVSRAAAAAAADAHDDPPLKRRRIYEDAYDNADVTGDFERLKDAVEMFVTGLQTRRQQHRPSRMQ